ncbi:MAG: tagaturonate epimerase family protein [Desulfovibrionaceae bacterium]
MYHQHKIASAFGVDRAARYGARERGEVREALEAVLSGPRVAEASLCRLPKGLAGVWRMGGQTRAFVAFRPDAVPAWLDGFVGVRRDAGQLAVLEGDTSMANAAWLHAVVPITRPQPLGLAPSFGFGDRLGLATPGHAAAMFAEGGAMLPIFAQQSVRELQRTERTPEEVMAAGTWGAFVAGWDKPCGADADHLKTPADLEGMARAGFTFFTLDPSDHVDQHADGYAPALLEEKYAALLAGKVDGAADCEALYLNRRYPLDGCADGGAGGVEVVFDRPTLLRAVVKYGRALAHVRAMAAHAATVMAGRGFELELSVDETEEPTSVAEHLFIALELRRHGVVLASLAPRFVGRFEKGVDFKGDIEELRRTLALHAAIAAQYGPYKISLHSGSDKFSVYPLLARACKGRFHVKTAGTSYLEALRVVCRVNEPLFREIVGFSRERFETDKATYHIDTGLDRVAAPLGLSATALEALYLDQDEGRQIMHVTFGSVLTVRDGGGYRYKDAILDILRANRDLHDSVLKAHLGKHLRLLAP